MMTISPKLKAEMLWKSVGDTLSNYTIIDKAKLQKEICLHIICEAEFYAPREDTMNWIKCAKEIHGIYKSLEK